MQPTSFEGNLTDRHYITLIVRLTLDRERRLVQGELVDTVDTLEKRFIDVAGLNQAMHRWLVQHVRAEEDT